jgi:hypothetical protein
MAELKTNDYNEESIKSLDWREHIRLRPGMYIGKLGDGSSMDDGIYILLKEVVDNSIDEFTMGHGKRIDVKISEGIVSVRDFGRGIPLGKVVDVVSKINTGAKYDSKAFQKSVGLNGVGTKAVNALSQTFSVTAIREGRMKKADFERGILVKEHKEVATTEANGTMMTFTPDDTVFRNYHFISEYVENQIWNYCYLNAGLTIHFNGRNYLSKNGLLNPSASVSCGMLMPSADWQRAILISTRKPYSSCAVIFMAVLYSFYNIPISSCAASDIMLLSQVGVHVTLTCTSVTPSISFTFSSTSRGSDWAAGQLGVVRVITTPTL